MTAIRLLTAILALMPLAGCNFAMRHTLDSPGQNQTVRVESGDRLYFDLDEESDLRWSARCDDSDVVVRIKHDRDAEKAKVEVRIHRGYDGPSTVFFKYGKPGEKAKKEWALALFRRTGDCAFWE